MPFLVLTGEKASGTFLIAQGSWSRPTSTGAVVKGSGHWLMEEATEEVVPRSWRSSTAASARIDGILACCEEQAFTCSIHAASE